MSTLLSVENLTVTFHFSSGALPAVRNISFAVEQGERVGIVGESGAGKSITGFSLLNLLPPVAKITEGKILFEGVDLVQATRKELETVRGNKISMILQDAMTTLNPVLTIGEQIIETIIAHKKVSKKEARAMAIDVLNKVCIPSPEQRLSQYAHQFSGGMRQRIVIAIALITHPQLIIADEPTTALDVTTQAEIMSLLLQLCKEEGSGLILVTHDLGIVSQMTEKLIVMYAGSIVEMGSTRMIIEQPTHPYTKGLLASLPENANKETHRLYQIPGSMPALSEIPKGCPFYERCPYKIERCEREKPPLQDYKGIQRACFVEL